MLAPVEPALISAFVTRAMQDELVVPRHIDPGNPLGVGALNIAGKTLSLAGRKLVAPGHRYTVGLRCFIHCELN